MRQNRALMSLLSLIAIASSAHASVSFYTGPTGAADFAAATAGFNFVVPLVSPVVFSASGLQASQDTYIDPTTGATIYGYFNSSGNLSNLVVIGSTLKEVNGGTSNSMDFNIPGSGGYTALALHMAEAGSGASVGCAELISSAQNFNSTTNCPNASQQFTIANSSDVQFVGIVSSAPLTDVFLGDIAGTGNLI